MVWPTMTLTSGPLFTSTRVEVALSVAWLYTHPEAQEPFTWTLLPMSPSILVALAVIVLCHTFVPWLIDSPVHFMVVQPACGVSGDTTPSPAEIEE
ncbi:MAG: hypothetical protein A4E49_01682 [Methanosaeta sp. PtaU1.Bin112]|nr:MAG: hypothetical protein A4E49_01682 [Methanosaeta sp. PtaU1.Bin112]